MKKVYVICLLLCVGLLAGCGKKKETKTEATEKKTEAVTETEAEAEVIEAVPDEDNKEKNILIAIDPGHQGPNVDMSATEPNAPGSSTMKTKATGGTTGRFTDVAEYQLNLDISLKLRDALIADGYQVLLTREDNDAAISNAERATLANNAGADVSIRIHANGSDDSSVNGALMLIGSSDNAYVGSLYDDSYRLAGEVLDHYCSATGMANRGIQTNDTMTGINWSTIPVVILEMGFMTNESDDRNMQDSSFQERMVQGIVDGINAYYGFDSAESNTATESREKIDGLEEDLKGVLAASAVLSDDTSVYVIDLNHDTCAALGEGAMQSASLIKLFVAGCVYEHMDEMKSRESYDGETEELVASMLTVSDNDATNTLVKRLGDGKAEDGMYLVNLYCGKHGFSNTVMGRLMLDFSSEADNYTSAKDCANFLQMLTQDKLEGSESILGYLKKQERTGKIPAGVPEDVTTANKTGELEDVENDAAIVYAEGRPYIICIMMDDLADAAAGRETIIQLSSKTYSYFME